MGLAVSLVHFPPKTLWIYFMKTGFWVMSLRYSPANRTTYLFLRELIGRSVTPPPTNCLLARIVHSVHSGLVGGGRVVSSLLPLSCLVSASPSLRSLNNGQWKRQHVMYRYACRYAVSCRYISFLCRDLISFLFACTCVTTCNGKRRHPLMRSPCGVKKRV